MTTYLYAWQCIHTHDNLSILTTTQHYHDNPPVYMTTLHLHMTTHSYIWQPTSTHDNPPLPMTKPYTLYPHLHMTTHNFTGQPIYTHDNLSIHMTIYSYIWQHSLTHDNPPVYMATHLHVTVVSLPDGLLVSELLLICCLTSGCDTLLVSGFFWTMGLLVTVLLFLDRSLLPSTAFLSLFSS